MRLATSGGTRDFPYFFQGALLRPRLTALLLRALSKIVAARFHIPAAMLRRILAMSDPVVTSGGGLLRFEGFSGCCSTYCRVDLLPDAYTGVVVEQGTTNVDFNAGMRAALAQIRDHERVGFAVGTDEVTLLRGSDQVIERKVKLPVRWLKGFVEVQAYQARMQQCASVRKVEAVRFIRSLPRTIIGKTSYWVVPGPQGLRLSQREVRDGIRVAGLERLRVLDELVPSCDGLSIHADVEGSATEWVLHFGPLNFHLTLTADVWRGFSGEGQALCDLASKERAAALELTQGALRWQAELRASELAVNWDIATDTVRQSLAVLGSRGLVGFDVARTAYFHRELPFDLSLVEELHPRLKAAREIMANGGVKLLRASEDTTECEVQGTGVIHRVRLSEELDRCTCPWFAKHQGARGPCKHILAAQLQMETETPTT